MEGLTILLELTRRCNLLCKHCYNSSSIDSPLQLSVEEVKTLISDIKKIEKGYPIERIILTGGEFITMDHSDEIFNMIRENFTCLLRIETNGFLFYNNPTLLEKYPADEFFISVDKFHGTLNDDGTSDILSFFLKHSKNKIVARVTIEQGSEDVKDRFLELYEKYNNLTIEVKYVSPTGRAGKNFEGFKGYKFSENPKLFKCLAKNYLHFNVSRNWYCCYTACDISRFAKLGDENLIEKFEKIYLSDEMKEIRDKGIVTLAKDDSEKTKLEKKSFYYRCEPCLYLQQLHKKEIILVDLPAVDPAQDVYIKGFIFPTFTEKYLRVILEEAGIKVHYYNLNRMDVDKAVKEINKMDVPVYIHLISNKLYSYNLFKKMIKNQILVGGPFVKFEKNVFTNEVIIDNELEENGILQFFGMEERNIWEMPTFKPQMIKTNYKNTSIENDFSNVILLSRGCLYGCKFCIHSCYHKKLHVRNIQSIALELNEYKGLETSVYIADASIGNMDVYGEVLELLSKYKNIRFSFNIRADQINNVTIDKIKKINIDRLYIGVEATDENMLLKYNKGENLETISKALELLKKNNIEFHLSFILDEQFKDVDIQALNDRFGAKTYSFHYYIPYPGTYGYEGNYEFFIDRDWPNKIYSGSKELEKLKSTISSKLGYPLNKYHTITPHNHESTFKIISDKLDEMEKLINESNIK